MPTSCVAKLPLLLGMLRDAAREMLGVSKGRSRGIRGAWWWNEEVQERVKSKQVAYAKLMSSTKEERSNWVVQY